MNVGNLIWYGEDKSIPGGIDATLIGTNTWLLGRVPTQEEINKVKAAFTISEPLEEKNIINPSARILSVYDKHYISGQTLMVEEYSMRHRPDSEQTYRYNNLGALKNFYNCLNTTFSPALQPTAESLHNIIFQAIENRPLLYETHTMEGLLFIINPKFLPWYEALGFTLTDSGTYEMDSLIRCYPELITSEFMDMDKVAIIRTNWATMDCNTGNIGHDSAVRILQLSVNCIRNMVGLESIEGGEGTLHYERTGKVEFCFIQKPNNKLEFDDELTTAMYGPGTVTPTDYVITKRVPYSLPCDPDNSSKAFVQAEKSPLETLSIHSLYCTCGTKISTIQGSEDIKEEGACYTYRGERCTGENN